MKVGGCVSVNATEQDTILKAFHDDPIQKYLEPFEHLVNGNNSHSPLGIEGLIMGSTANCHEISGQGKNTDMIEVL